MSWCPPFVDSDPRLLQDKLCRCGSPQAFLRHGVSSLRSVVARSGKLGQGSPASCLRKYGAHPVGGDRLDTAMIGLSITSEQRRFLVLDDRWCGFQRHN